MSAARHLTLLAAATALTAALAAPAVQAAPRPADAATTGEHSELRKTVPITRTPGAAPRTVLSMGPGKLSGLERGDRLQLSSEVQVTVDCDKPSSRCAGRPYGFDPHVRVGLRLGRSGSPSAGGRVLARRSLTCRQQLPNRQHHCPVGGPARVRSPARPARPRPSRRRCRGR